ncbi:MAG: hypothetical protein H8D87_01385, partial [Deltaproteobacteria bacterium]|nr:hypothetical protein [Candidatus Desulfobacula maris]
NLSILPWSGVKKIGGGFGAGDPIVEVVNTWYYGKNEGIEPVDIILKISKGRKNVSA